MFSNLSKGVRAGKNLRAFVLTKLLIYCTFVLCRAVTYIDFPRLADPNNCVYQFGRIHFLLFTPLLFFCGTRGEKLYNPPQESCPSRPVL